MLQYFLAFLLINTFYQSLGNPVPEQHNISESLTLLAKECENPFLSKAISIKIKECAVSAPPYHLKQIRCLIFYDINKQLCAAIAASELKLNEDRDKVKLLQKQDVKDVCTQAKDWIFTNISEYASYKNTSDLLLKSPFTCGEVCGVEELMNETNDYCRYFNWGTDLMKTRVSTVANDVNNNVETAAVISEPEANARGDIAVINNPPSSTQLGDTKKQAGTVKQTESALPKTPEKTEPESGDVAVKSSTSQMSSKQPPSQEEQPMQKTEDVEVKPSAGEQPVIKPPGVEPNKSVAPNDPKPDLLNDPAVPPEANKILPGLDSKDAVLEKADGKIPSDADDYADSEGGDAGDDDAEDTGIEMKPGPEAKPEFNSRLTPAHNGDISQKDYYHNTMPDGFTEDSDHFFPFFLTAIILVVLLYVLYHNKSKVTKVFFGLILEGRQGSRRRNSRGHQYRRLDTLEQAMSANTTAPPSKIIY